MHGEFHKTGILMLIVTFTFGRSFLSRFKFVRDYFPSFFNCKMNSEFSLLYTRTYSHRYFYSILFCFIFFQLSSYIEYIVLLHLSRMYTLHLLAYEDFQQSLNCTEKICIFCFGLCTKFDKLYDIYFK